MSNINSSFSDDGRSLTFCRQHLLTRILGRRSEGDKGYSLQVEYSDRGKPLDYYVNRISEEEFESERERRSSPPGTIGDAQDVMSENIESTLKLLRRKQHHGHGHPQTYKDGTSSGTAFECKCIFNNIDFSGPRAHPPAQR